MIFYVIFKISDLDGNSTKKNQNKEMKINKANFDKQRGSYFIEL